jgi:hypothetical protein
VGIGHDLYQRLSAFEVPLGPASLTTGALVLIGMLFIGYGIGHHTRFGRTLLAMGGNEQSALLMGLVFGWYLVRRAAAGSGWAFVHGAVPVVLLVAVAVGRSYGVWQKGLIVYYVLAVNLDCLAALPRPERRKRRRKTGVYAPRVVWRRYDGPGRPDQ